MRKLLKYSAIISLIGIFLLLFLSINLPVKEYKITELTKKMTGTKVEITGKITKINIYSGLETLTVSDNTNKITVLLDKPSNISINKTVRVIGILEEYKNSLEIRADRLSI